MELGGTQGTMFDRRDESILLVGAPGDAGVRWKIRLVVHRVGVHEIEALIRDRVEQHRMRGCCHGVPAHVRQPAADQLFDQPREDTNPFGEHAMFDTGLEHHLVSDADAENRPMLGQPQPDQVRTADMAQAGHAGGEGTHSRDDQPVSPGRQGGISADDYVRTCCRERPGHRMEVSRTVVQNNDGRSSHKMPLVDGISPTTRVSMVSASRKARATALYCASTI